MCKKLTYLLTLVFVLGVAGHASAELVGHWRLDEGSGTTVYDSSASGNDGTFEGDPEWVAGQYGDALEFDGDDWVNFGAPPELVINGEISITCWVNPTGFVGRQGFACLDAGFAFKVHEGGRLCFTTPGILDHESASTILEAGAWQHAAVTFTPGQAEGVVFYLNGVETDRLTASSMNAGSGPFRLGNNQWSETLTGMLDHATAATKISVLQKELRSHIQAVRQLTDGIDRRGLLLAGADRCLRELVNSFEDSPTMSDLIDEASIVVWSTIEREEKS